MVAVFPPMVSPRFQSTGYLLQYKPFPSYANWLEAWDMTFIGDDIAGLQNLTVAIVDNLVDISSQVEGLATEVIAAQTAAAAAQSTADDALAAANDAAGDAAQVSYFEFFGDSMFHSVGTPSRAVSNSLPYNWGVFTTTDGATCEREFMAKAGTWEIKILTVKANNYGRLRFTIDGVESNQIDLYAAATDNAFIITLSAVVLSGNQHTLSVTVQGKNASSTGYVMLINKVWGRRTGA